MSPQSLALIRQLFVQDAQNGNVRSQAESFVVLILRVHLLARIVWVRKDRVRFSPAVPS